MFNNLDIVAGVVGGIVAFLIALVWLILPFVIWRKMNVLIAVAKRTAKAEEEIAQIAILAHADRVLGGKGYPKPGSTHAI